MYVGGYSKAADFLFLHEKINQVDFLHIHLCVCLLYISIYL